MNAAFLLVCSLSLGQSVADVSAVSASEPDLDGTFSVLVKITTLADASTVAAASHSVAAPSQSATVSSAQDIADVPEFEPAPEAANPPQVLTPVPPLDRSVAAGSGDASLSQSPVALASTAPSQLRAQEATSEPPNLAKRLLQDALSAPPQAALTGAPLTLRDAIAGTTDRQLQLQIVSAYWQLTASLANCRFTLDEVEQLANVTPRETPEAAVKLAAAQAAATAELKAAELNAVSKQYALAEMVSNGVLSQPVLPTDLPIVGPYETRFESLFAGRPAPAGLHRIHRVLPLRLAAIDARATAVDAAEKLVSQAQSGYVAGEIGLGELLQGLEDSRSQRHALVAAARDYNIDIAAYALAVVGTNVAHETVVSMLVETPPQVPSGPSSPAGQTRAIPGVFVAPAVSGQPTLATAPAEASPPTAPLHSPQAVPVMVEPATVSPPADNVQRPSTGVPPAPADSGASPFRDVTPSESPPPEVLVPLRPVRYRSNSLAPGMQAPAASSSNR